MYIPCYVISLEHEVQKRENLINELNKRGIVPHHYRGIYGKKLDPSFYPYTPRGVLGCALSHIGVAKDFLKTDYDYCLVLEDDAVPVFDNVEEIYRIVQNAPEDMDSLLLYCMMYCFDTLVAKVMETKYYESMFPVSGAAYIMTKRAAKIQSEMKPYFHIDFLRQQSDMKIYAVEPQLFYSPTRSENSHTRSSTNINLLKHKTFDGGLDLNEVVKFKVLRMPFLNGLEIDTLTLIIILIFVAIAIAMLLIYYFKLFQQSSIKGTTLPMEILTSTSISVVDDTDK
jgi:hypothetical protein